MTISTNLELPVIAFEVARLNDGTYIKKEITETIIKINENQYYLEKPIINPITGIPDYDKTTITKLQSTAEFVNSLTLFVNSKANGEFNSNALYGNTHSKRLDTQSHIYLPTKVNDEISLNYLFKYFYSNFFSSAGHEFDVTGYTLVFLYPPDFSGFSKFSKSYATALLNGEIAKYNQEIIEYNATHNPDKPTLSSIPPYEYISPDNAFIKHFLDYMMFAVEFSIPDQDISTSQIDLSFGQNMEFVSGFNTSGNLSIKYLDNVRLKNYHFHNIWVLYMKMVMRGDIEPESTYYDSKELDYMGSLYFLKFKPGMDLPNYIGKATGIFPKNMPVNDILGNRTENQLVMYTINYFYSMYEGTVLNFVEDLDFEKPSFPVGSNYGLVNNSMDKWKLTQPSELFEEFKKLIFSAYSVKYAPQISPSEIL